MGLLMLKHQEIALDLPSTQPHPCGSVGASSSLPISPHSQPSALPEFLPIASGTLPMFAVLFARRVETIRPLEEHCRK